MYLPALSDKDVKDLLYRWSPSKIKAWYRCQLESYFNYVAVDENGQRLNQQKPEVPILATGTVAHKVLELFFAKRLKKGYQSPETFVATFKSMWWAAVKGEKWRNKKWNWSSIGFKQEEDRFKFLNWVIQALPSFYWKNIDYFVDQLPDLKRPLVEFKFKDEHFGYRQKFTLERIVDRVQIWPDENGKLKVWLVDYKVGNASHQLRLEGHDIAQIAETWLFLHANSTGFDYPLGGSLLYPLSDPNRTNLFMSDKLLLQVKRENGLFGPLKREELISMPLPTEHHFCLLSDLVMKAKRELAEALQRRKFLVMSSSDSCRFCRFGKECRQEVSQWKGRQPQPLVLQRRVTGRKAGVSAMKGKQLRFRFR